MSTFEWVSCDARTGKVIASLPGLDVPKVEDAMMSYATASATLTVTDKTDPEWIAATRPGGAYLVLLEDGLPTWGGLIGRRTRGVSDSVQLDLATVASYLRRRFVGDESFASEDQCAIVEAVVAEYGATDGLPFEFDVAVSATTRDRTYTDDSDKSVFSIISELAGVEDGPEWCISWQAGDAIDGQRVFVPLLKVADRLGTTPNPGMEPAVTWEFPGAVSDVSLTEDFGDGKGANDVLAVSTAVNDVRPESSHATLADDARPKYEMRFTPSTSIVETATLDAHAERKLAQVGYGSLTLELTLPAEVARLGRNFGVGDVVGFSIGGPAHPMLAYPGGVKGTGRVTGYSRTFNDVPMVTPWLEDVEITDGRF